MISAEKGTLFSSLLSQRNVWTIPQIIKLAKTLLSPISGLSISDLEPSHEVSMLKDIVNILPYKMTVYKNIVELLYQNNGMACDELEINVFNADCGLDSIAFLSNLISNGYKIEVIKSLKLFSINKESLERALLLHKYLFPQIKVLPYNLCVNEISDESKCNSLLTVNIFPNTYTISKNIASKIGDLLIKSHQLYSHSIFFEFVDADEINSIPSLDCKYYWLDLHKTMFIKNPPKEYSFTPRTKSVESLNLSCSSKYCIFSNLSLEDLSIKHKYKIVLEDLCPGTPSRSLYNEKKTYTLFYDTPFENSSDLNTNLDNTEIVAIEKNFSHDVEKEYTLLGAVKEFPHYLIAKALFDNKKWANDLFSFYLSQAEKGNFKCYNNLAVLKTLINCLDEDFESQRNQEIIKYYLLAIDGGDTAAMLNIASFYMSYGKHEEAIQFYELAFQNGSCLGAYSVALANHFGLCGLPVNKDKAIDVYRNFFELLKTEIENDSDNFSLESENCLNLIILLYELGYNLCDITKEYQKVKKPSDSLIYAYTVISNNLSNKAPNLFKVLKLLEPQNDKEPSYITYNRICALYNGVVNGKDKLLAKPEEALEQLKNLADTKCPDWPEWERYVWNKLALWTSNCKDNSEILASTYWLKAIQAYPQRECAYRTNIALCGKISEEEQKSIWHTFAFGNGCDKCHECNNYDNIHKCCPKAQLQWARSYEKDSSIADYILNLAISQNYVNAIEEKAINRIYKQQGLSVPEFDLLIFYFGFFPNSFLPILDKFGSPDNISLLWQATNLGSKKAAVILLKILEQSPSDYEYYYLTFMSAKNLDKAPIYKKLSKKTLTNGYFEASSLIEQDYLNFENIIAEQFLGTEEIAFMHLKELAEFYFDGGYYHKALNLYKIALEKEFDVSERISEIEEIIAEEERRSYVHDYNDYEDYDYDAERWDALTDGMYGDYPGPGVDYDALGF